ncbi:hypothetical protein V4Z64_005012 [Pseudomonas aeruginosa]|uniref:hypothetical protein n=1 Tax=Pseudomonas aeruginosa TaxID=287 RepID=UPI0015F06868|nr:hypothetical protein [Pseudomonas aeruginosa]MBA5106064.1 hypothetical protein [Pseudomonas aeruginosa]MDP5989999.1 hypothetical protein [Pseudomonas aeruginosa]HCE9175717.1 hypothetical protein [Pseudomonas aeruginosa]HEJ9771296.1 hypothetical protein [Pseudomonas aeruginosa]HEO1611754.1 hypothetical protein [Pseudomonas aeruginosa]
MRILATVATASLAVLVGGGGHASASEHTVEALNAVLQGAMATQRSGQQGQSCSDLRTHGRLVAADPDAAERMFTKALSMRVIADGRYYQGLVDLARSGVNFDRLADACSRALQRDTGKEIRRSFDVIRKASQDRLNPPAPYPVFVM